MRGGEVSRSNARLRHGPVPGGGSTERGKASSASASTASDAHAQQASCCAFGSWEAALEWSAAQQDGGNEGGVDDVCGGGSGGFVVGDCWQARGGPFAHALTSGGGASSDEAVAARTEEAFFTAVAAVADAVVAAVAAAFAGLARRTRGCLFGI